jgi:hypothetical protein
MTDDRSLERAARSWIEVGPTAAPPHVVDAALGLIERTPQERDWFPWRFPRMSNSARMVALVAIGALILAGAFALAGVGGRGGPLPSTAPSASAVASAIASAAAGPSTLTLSETFVSPTYGYTVKIPAGWSIKPATKSWSTGDVNLWNSGFNDELSLAGAGMRFSGTSQSLAKGQTGDQWLTAYAASAGNSSRSGWLEIQIGGQTGYLTANGVAAGGGTIAPGGVMFDSVVIDNDRAYNFNMDGKLDRATFDAIVATIALDPSSVGALPALDKSFTSPSYGYTIKQSADWTVKAATAHWKGVDNSPPATDEMTITGTDSVVSIASQSLGGKTLDEFLVPFHAFTIANVPPGCDGGEPSTWPSTPIGPETGRWYELCNASEAVVEVGGRVYAFSLGNNTFDGSRHLHTASWLRLLETVTFDPGSAVDR